MKRNILLVLEYDGTEFHGFQRQDGLRTVQGELERALAVMLGEEARLRSSSRTDAGVHALAHPVNFLTEKERPLKAYFLGCNSLLPPDLAVRQALEVPLDFDARSDSLGKRYRYAVLNTRGRRPAMERTAWHVEWPLDIERMQAAARHLLGEHDLSAFRSAHCDSLSTERYVRAIDISRKGDLVEIEIEANAFLRNMARIITGTLVEVGRGKRDPAWVLELLNNRIRAEAGMTAPAKGLCLLRVFYDERVFIDCCPEGPVYSPGRVRLED